jgi:hypothetical protein
MCYPKPGPRCSNHARKKLVLAQTAERENRTLETREALETAEEEFFMTPAGLRELQHLISKGDDVEYDTLRLQHFTQARADSLAAIKATEQGDIEHKLTYHDGFNPENTTLLPHTSTAVTAWHAKTPEETSALMNQYIESSARWVDKLTPEEVHSVKWFTSNGFHEMGQQDRGTGYMAGFDDTETDAEKNARISKSRASLDSALSKIDGQPRLVYRGLSPHSTPEHLNKHKTDRRSTYGPPVEQYGSEEEYQQHVDSYFENLTGTEMTFDRPVSAAADPGVGYGFTGLSSSPKIIYEISTRKGAPAGAASTWGTVEAEVIVQGNQKFKVVGVRRNVELKRRNRKGEETTTTTNIVQLVDAS